VRRSGNPPARENRVTSLLALEGKGAPLRGKLEDDPRLNRPNRTSTSYGQPSLFQRKVPGALVKNEEGDPPSVLRGLRRRGAAEGKVRTSNGGRICSQRASIEKRSRPWETSSLAREGRKRLSTANEKERKGKG